MGVVGLSFGSATSGTGFDVSSTVNQIVTNLQAVETPWKNQLTTLQGQDTNLTSIGTELNTLLTSLQNLTDFTAALASKAGSSSDPSVLSLTSATSSATAGSHTIVVSQLAKTESYASDYISAASDSLTGSIVIGTTTINVDSADGTNTLAGLVSQINSDGLGVTASVLTGTSGSKLSIVSNTSGSSGIFTVSGSLTDVTSGNASIGVSVAQTAQDAAFTVDGVSLTSSSNTVSNAISGVTFQLLTTAPSETVQIQITNDTSTAGNAIISFVTNYNTVIDAVNAQEGKDANGNPEPLYGSSIIAQLQQQLESGVIFSDASGTIKSLFDLGVTMNNDGTLSVNTDTLTSNLNSNYSSVVSFFQDSGNFGSNLGTVLNNLGDVSPTGLITVSLNEITSEEKTVNDKIAAEETLISTQKATLTAELNQANQTLQEIPLQLNMVNEIYSASTGYNTKQ